METIESLAQLIMASVGHGPDGVSFQTLWERAVAAVPSLEHEGFVQALYALLEQGRLAGQLEDGVWVYRAGAGAELAFFECEYSEEFAQIILGIETNETFHELDCDSHLAYLDSLIEQARTGGKLN